jgi:hypothetical protein
VTELRDIIAFRNSELHNRTANATSTSTSAVVQLSLRSAYEARVVKVLTVVAIIFVPASFAAVKTEFCLRLPHTLTLNIGLPADGLCLS